MAERISHDVTPPKIGPDAHEALEALLQTLHEHGVLRFANDIVAANSDVTRLLVNGLSNEGSLNTIQNLSIILMALSTLPPDRFYQVMMAVRDGVDQIGSYRSRGSSSDNSSSTKSEADSAEAMNKEEASKGEAPGVSGVYKMLHNDELWHAIQPLLAGIRAFSERLDTPVDKPVTDFTGKPTEGP
tara:strand:+ start:58363 stop:58920 length:558 start_codon:yes stop_codon:yes gene_type:complete